MLSSLAALFVTPTLIQAQLPSSPALQADLSQQIKAASKPAIVRVVASCSGRYSYSRNEFSTNEVSLVAGEVGTGFFVNPDGYIITNSHILSPADESSCRELLFRRLAEFVTGQQNFDQIPVETKNNLRNRSQIKGEINYINQVVLPTGASLPFTIKQLGIPSGGKIGELGIVKINVSNAPTLKLAESSKIEPQTAFATIGYLIDSSFKSLSFASSAPEDLSALAALKEFSLGKSLGGITVLDGWASKSNSPSGDTQTTLQFNDILPLGILGSPVLNGKDQVVGMVALDKQASQEGSNSANVISSTAILDSLKQIGSKNEPSSTDKLYQEGLTLLKQGDFQAAKAKFQAVQNLFPYHSEANALIQESDQKLADARKKKMLFLWLVGGGAILGAIAVIYFVSRSRGRRQRFNRAPFAEKRVSPELAPTPVGSVTPIATGQPERPPKPPKTRQPAVTQILGHAFSSPTVIGTQPFVDLKNQDGQVRRFYLRQDRHQLGRDRDWADLYISDDGWEVLSRHHAVLEREGETYRIYDGDRQSPSTNGIFVNGTPVTTHAGYLLQDGDQVITGNDPRNQVILTYSNPDSERLTPSQSQIDSKS